MLDDEGFCQITFTRLNGGDAVQNGIGLAMLRIYQPNRQHIAADWEPKEGTNMLNDLAIYQMAKSRANWAEERQKVLATNIAQGDVPGAKSYDIEEMDFSRAMANQQKTAVAVERTNPMHMEGAAAPKTSYRSKADRLPYELSPNENGIVMEEQMFKVANTRRQHANAMTMMKTYNRLINLPLSSQ